MFFFKEKIRLKMFLFVLIIWFLFLSIESQSDFMETNFQEIVYPTVISQDKVRRRRSFPDEEDTVFISISNWTLRTKLNSALIIPNNFDVWTFSYNEINQGSKFSTDCQAVRGFIEDDLHSVVVLTICQNEFYGLVIVENRYLFIQPITDGKHILFEDEKLRWKVLKENNNFSTLLEAKGENNNNQNRKLRRKKRNNQMESSEHFYNLTGDTFEIESEIDTFNKEYQQNLEIDQSSQEIGYFLDKTWKWSKLPKRKTVYKEASPRWLEIGIAADYSVVDFHGTRIQHYILALLNIIRLGNARKSLENVNKWHRKLLSSTEEPHDAAVWLTRLDIGGPSGYAPVSGVCDPSRSCALNRDEGLTSAFIIAHEIAHILGLSHDGDVNSGNACGEEATRGSVMAPMVAATFHRFHWSSCSRKELQRKARQWSCLLNQPQEESSTQFQESTIASFTMDEQCRMEFGEGYQLCRSYDSLEPCSHLWCNKPNISQICKTKKGPPLEGTICGENKWCINGFCEFIDRKKFDKNPVVYNGKNVFLGNWSNWGKCSTTCGIGVQFRTRKCNEYYDAHEESNCKGKIQEFRICQQENCLIISDLRLQQCSRLSSLINFEKPLLNLDNTWLPYEPETEELKCQLICKSKETGNLYNSHKNLRDGTPCSYESNDICVQGKCYPMGCDNIFNSTKKKDSCGVCGGDNSTCENVSKKFQRKLRRPFTRLGAIPPSAYNIRIDITISGLHTSLNSTISIVIKDGQKQTSDIKYFDSQGKGQILIVEGAAFRPQKINDTYTMWARGPLLREIIFSLSLSDLLVPKGVFISVFSRYIINRSQKKKNKHVWLSGGWSPCSVSCGSGYRQRTLACKDIERGKIVHKRKCPIDSKPALEIEMCEYFSCDFKWLEGPWESCSKTCGEDGFQQRQLYCVHSSFKENQMAHDNENLIYNIMVSPDRCQKQKAPITERECNRIPCAGQWIYSEWSQCSQSCGIGIQSQIARCVSLEGELSNSCNGTYLPDKMRLCRGASKRNSNCANYCQKDKSQYCSLKNLKRYCQIPAFRRKCCLSCQKDYCLSNRTETPVGNSLQNSSNYLRAVPNLGARAKKAFS